MIKIVKDVLVFLLMIVEGFLLFRFVLKVLAANPETPFVNWVYQTTEPLLQPFQYAFPSASAKGGFVIEFTTLFALFAYAFAGYLLEQILELIYKHQSAS